MGKRETVVADVGRDAGSAARTGEPLLHKSALYADLKARILKLDLKPGEPISEIALAADYHVSRTPVREALQRLLADGLVDVRGRSGTHVSRIPVNQLPQAIIVRKALEGVTTRLAVKQATQSRLLELEARVERMRELAPGGDREAFHLADEAFHATIAEMAGYPGIWTMVEKAKMHVDRFRRVSLPQEGRIARVIEEHAAIFAAISARDADRAVALMERHIDGLELDLEVIRQLAPAFFVDDEPLSR